MNWPIEIVNRDTGERREIAIDRGKERIEFLLRNAAEETKSLRIQFGDNTVWIGVDGYGEPDSVDDEAYQVLVDVYHMDMSDESYGGDIPDHAGHPFVRVFTDMDDDDPPLIKLSRLRLFTMEQALERIHKFVGVDNDSAHWALRQVDNILMRVRNKTFE